MVVGTALETAMASILVKNALEQDIMTIEINLEPCIKEGHVLHVVGKSETALPQLVKGYKQIRKSSDASTKASER